MSDETCYSLKNEDWRSNLRRNDGLGYRSKISIHRFSHRFFELALSEAPWPRWLYYRVTSRKSARTGASPLKHGDAEKSVAFGQSILLAVPVSYLFFIPFFIPKVAEFGFWLVYGLGLSLLVAGYFLHQSLINWLSWTTATTNTL